MSAPRATGPSAEVAAVADDLTRLAPSLERADVQDGVERVAGALRELVGLLEQDPPGVGSTLPGFATLIERAGATAGGYGLLRPMLELGRRLRAVQDVVDPAERVACPRCNQPMRTRPDPGTGQPGPESHTDQAGSVCT